MNINNCKERIDIFFEYMEKKTDKFTKKDALIISDIKQTYANLQIGTCVNILCDILPNSDECRKAVLVETMYKDTIEDINTK